MNNLMSLHTTEHDPVITVSLPLSEWQTISASLRIANVGAQYDADADEAIGYYRAHHTRRTSSLISLVFRKLMSEFLETALRKDIPLDVFPFAENEDITDDEFTAINNRYEEATYNAVYSHSVSADEAVPF